MDADVLYGDAMIERQINSHHQNCLLLDHGFDPGDEPVKLCIRDGEILEFHKWLSADFDFCGVSVGFFKLTAEVAKKIIIQTELYLDQGRRHELYEEAIHDLLLTSPHATFAFEGITVTPWIEIDFAVDIERANTVVLPLILAEKEERAAAFMSIRGIDTIATQTL
jgi:choline kinase